MKKSKPPKKLPENVADAQFSLNHAVVRGEPQDVLQKLRDTLAEEKRKAGIKD